MFDNFGGYMPDVLLQFFVVEVFYSSRCLRRSGQTEVLRVVITYLPGTWGISGSEFQKCFECNARTAIGVDVCENVARGHDYTSTCLVEQRDEFHVSYSANNVKEVLIIG